MIKRRSDTEILQFIRDLPGGNVPQYAKLLNTTPVRLNTLLNTRSGQRVVKAKLVCAPEKGMMPTWSNANTERGCLRARDVDTMYKNNALPPFVAKQLDSVHPRFHDDTLNFLREILDQTSNHSSVETQLRNYIAQDKDRTDQILAHEDKVYRLEREIRRYDLVLDRADSMATAIERLTHHKSNDAEETPLAVAAE